MDELVVVDQVLLLFEAAVGEVGDGRLVGGGVIGNFQRVVVAKFVHHNCGECAGIAFFAIFADVGEFYGGAVSGLDWLSLPDFAVEAFLAAMKGVGAVVEEQRVFLAVNREFAFCNAIAVAADGGAEKRVVPEVSRQIVEAENHIGVFATLIRHP